FLLLGSSEAIGNFGDLFGFVDRKHKIYRKKNVVARPVVDFSAPRPELPLHENSRPEEQEGPGAANAIFRDADRVLLNRFTPSGVLLDDHLNVLQFRGHTSRYLEPAPGMASFNILKMAREGLLADLRTAIHTARKKDAPERREGVRVKLNEHSLTVNLEVIPFVGSSRERFIVVLFDEPEEKEGKASKKKGDLADGETSQTG